MQQQQQNECEMRAISPRESRLDFRVFGLFRVIVVVPKDENEKEREEEKRGRRMEPGRGRTKDERYFH